MKRKKSRTSPADPQRGSAAVQNGEKALAAGRYAEAAECFAQISPGSSHYGRACRGNGLAHWKLGNLKDALFYLKAAHQAFPQDPQLLVDGGDVARELGGLNAAAAAYTAARELGADGFQIAFGEACLAQEGNHWVQAAALWDELNHSPGKNQFTLHNAGRVQHELGETDKAAALMDEAFALGGAIATLSMLALLAPHAGKCGHEAVKKYRVRLGERLTAEEGRPAGVPYGIKNRGKINIGYVSSFFHCRNWMKPVWALLNAHDRTKFRVHLFADCPPGDIGPACGYSPHGDDTVHDVRELTNRRLARRIRDSGIDVLVDLNGYSAMERLGLWVAKPAPVTVGWFNLYATSGMPGIEWLIGDHMVIDGAEEKDYTEKILRLDQSYLTFQVCYDTPDVKVPPGGEPFTFGCLGSAYKITPETRAAWIRILRETQGTRLLVRNRLLADESCREWLAGFFVREGIDPGRLMLLGPAEHTEFLETYGMIDLALDTFPYNGGTTTMESLWQGVPLVCFKGDRWASRTSATILHSAGFGEFIGGGVDEYVSIAREWSRPEKKKELSAMRLEMRARLERSAVCDGKGLAGNFERLVWSIVR